MRIPSQFNDSSLYRSRSTRSGRKATGSSEPWRRMARLGVAFFLVVVAMGQAKRPEVYQLFFDEQETWEKVESAQFSQAGLKVSPDQVSDVAHWPLAEPWGRSMSIEIQREWMKTLVHWKRHGKLADGTGLIASQSIAECRELLREMEEPAEDAERVEKLAATLEFLESKTQLDELPWNQIIWWGIPLLDVLDQEALSRVSDGTFWNGDDSDAFYLQLSRVDELVTDEAKTIGTLPLLQQPDVYRGETVQIIGRLGLAETQPARQNGYGMTQYSTLWIVPNDGGVRPIALIVPEIPKALSDHLDADGKWVPTAANSKGELVAVGRFVKRLPYRSSEGADLAPVVIGRVAAIRDQIARSAKPAPMKERSWHLGKWLGIVAAVALGIAFAGIAMRRASLDARRARVLRQKALSPDGLDQLVEPEPATRVDHDET